MAQDKDVTRRFMDRILDVTDPETKVPDITEPWPESKLTDREERELYDPENQGWTSDIEEDEPKTRPFSLDHIQWTDTHQPIPQEKDSGTNVEPDVKLRDLARWALRFNTEKYAPNLVVGLFDLCHKLTEYWHGQPNSWRAANKLESWMNNHPIMSYLSHLLKNVCNPNPDYTLRRVHVVVLDMAHLER